MKSYYIFNEDGIPVPAKDQYAYAKWAIKNNLSKTTKIENMDSLPIEIVTAFNYSEGYFSTFKFEGNLKIELEKSLTKTKSDLAHKKHVHALADNKKVSISEDFYF